MLDLGAVQDSMRMARKTLRFQGWKTFGGLGITCNPRATMSASTAFASQALAASFVKIDELMLNEPTKSEGLEDPAGLVLPSPSLPS